MKVLQFGMFLLILFVAPVLFYSCATTQTVTGKPIDPGLVATIVDGETTQEQIISLFGAPTSTSQLGDYTLYVYKHCVIKGTAFSAGYFGQSKGEEKCDELTVTFDKTGKVKAHNFVKRLEE